MKCINLSVWFINLFKCCTLCADWFQLLFINIAKTLFYSSTLIGLSTITPDMPRLANELMDFCRPGLQSVILVHSNSQNTTPPKTAHATVAHHTKTSKYETQRRPRRPRPIVAFHIVLSVTDLLSSTLACHWHAQCGVIVSRVAMSGGAGGGGAGGGGPRWPPCLSEGNSCSDPGC